MGKIAVSTCELTFTLISGPCTANGPITLPYPGVITTPLEEAVTPSGPLLLDKIQYIWSAGSPCPFSPDGPYEFNNGTGEIVGTTTKCKSNDKPLMQVDDLGSCAGQWLHIPTVSLVPCSCTATISNPGQDNIDGV